MGERDDGIAEANSRVAPGPMRRDLAADLEAGQGRGIGRRVVGAAALAEIGGVEPGGGDADQHLAGTGLRHGHGHRLQDLGAAEGGDGDGGHFGGYGHGVS